VTAEAKTSQLELCCGLCGRGRRAATGKRREQAVSRRVATAFGRHQGWVYAARRLNASLHLSTSCSASLLRDFTIVSRRSRGCDLAETSGLPLAVGASTSCAVKGRTYRPGRWPVVQHQEVLGRARPGHRGPRMINLFASTRLRSWRHSLVLYVHIRYVRTDVEATSPCPWHLAQRTTTSSSSKPDTGDEPGDDRPRWPASSDYRDSRASKICPDFPSDGIASS